MESDRESVNAADIPEKKQDSLHEDLVDHPKVEQDDLPEDLIEKTAKDFHISRKGKERVVPDSQYSIENVLISEGSSGSDAGGRERKREERDESAVAAADTSRRRRVTESDEVKMEGVDETNPATDPTEVLEEIVSTLYSLIERIILTVKDWQKGEIQEKDKSDLNDRVNLLLETLPRRIEEAVDEMERNKKDEEDQKQSYYPIRESHMRQIFSKLLEMIACLESSYNAAMALLKRRKIKRKELFFCVEELKETKEVLGGIMSRIKEGKPEQTATFFPETELTEVLKGIIREVTKNDSDSKKQRNL